MKKLAVGLAIASLLAACTGDPASKRDERQNSAKIPQPEVTGLAVAPDSDRVDLNLPSFSHPTRVTNPLFPVSEQESVLLLGHVDGKPFRTEVTLLPQTRLIEWQGMRIETLVSQYTAYLDGRIQEVAYDLYAQDDDGAVWYLGEEVSDFKDGAIVTTEGTWSAGKDGPGAMIMPADPQVGDAFRTENAPGFAFEEVTVREVGRTLEGPLGPIEGGITVGELHTDGKIEDKTFAPGYGEFLTAGGGDVEALALAVPTDAAGAPVPEGLMTLTTEAKRLSDLSRSPNWKTTSAATRRIAVAWKNVRAGAVPVRVEPRMTSALAALGRSVRARSSARTRQAAIQVAQWSLDLQLLYQPPREVDISRFDLWISQLLADASLSDLDAVRGDVFTLDYIRDRIMETLAPADLVQLNIHLGELQAAMVDADIDVARNEALQLHEVVSELGL